MSIRIVGTGILANQFQVDAARNASITDTIAFLGRVRAIQRTNTVRGSVAVRVGRALLRRNVKPKAITRVDSALVIEETGDLRTAIFDEVLWYARVGALQLRHASDAAMRGHPTAGQASAYYASFYMAQALCRLAGRIPLYLREYDARRPGPNVLLAWDGGKPPRGYSISQYLIKDAGGGQFGSHRALWNVFFQIFGGCVDVGAEHLDAVRPQSHAGEEVDLRNDNTYVPWLGFPEVGSLGSMQQVHGDYRAIDEQARIAIERNGLVALNALVTDPTFAPYAKACLRASLLRRFIDALAQRSEALAVAWDSARDDLRAQLASLGDPDASSAFLETALA